MSPNHAGYASALEEDITAVVRPLHCILNPNTYLGNFCHLEKIGS